MKNNRSEWSMIFAKNYTNFIKILFINYLQNVIMVKQYKILIPIIILTSRKSPSTFTSYYYRNLVFLVFSYLKFVLLEIKNINKRKINFI